MPQKGQNWRRLVSFGVFLENPKNNLVSSETSICRHFYFFESLSQDLWACFCSEFLLDAKHINYVHQHQYQNTAHDPRRSISVGLYL